MRATASRRDRLTVGQSLRRSSATGQPYRRTIAASRGGPNRGPLDDYWYHPVGYTRSAAGMNVTTDTALTIAAVYRAVRLLADDMAQLPLHLYRRLPDRTADDGRMLPGGKERVHNGLAEVIGKQPNPRQTSFQWRQMMAVHLLLRGNAYSRIISGPRGFVDRLEPLRPDRMRVVRLDMEPGLSQPGTVAPGRVLYIYRPKTGVEERYTQDEMFHLAGFSTDPEKPEGMSVIGFARTSLGLTMATEEFGSRQFSQTPRPSAAITSPNTISVERRQELEESFKAAWSGPAGWGGVPVMDNGMSFATIGMSHDDAQYLQTRQHQVADVARWFGVPPHKLGDLTRATFSNIEKEEISYVSHSLLNWLVLWEQTIGRDLILDDTFVEYVVDGLLRGDSLSRAKAQQIRANMRSLTPNEVRAQENMNPVPWGDEPLETQGAPPAPDADDDRESDPSRNGQAGNDAAAMSTNRMPAGA